MVNGNYVLYGDRPVSDSEIVEDHVQTRTAERKVKRKPNRTANELQHSLNMAQIDNETDSIKYEKRVKEPKLLRYVPTTDVEENFISEKFETYDMKPAEERPRRYAFTKKPKNPADGSVNYAYSRSSSSCSSPNGNLPTISEHGEQYGTYRIRTTSPHVSAVIPGYENKLDKYFAKPREVKKFAAKGSHPDSLYRVPVEDEVGSGKLTRALRLLRWPIALVLVCIALAVFVYFLMPDNMESELDAVNSTYWGTEPIAVEAVHSQGPHSSTSPPVTSTRHRKKTDHTTHSPGTKVSEIDFYDAVTVTDKNEVSSAVTSGLVVPTRKLPVPPVFPSHIAPEVQYGNERADIDKLRAPKLLEEKSLLPEDSTLKPHITQKPEKPLAVSFKDGISITSPSTETIFKAETNNDLINYGEKYTTIVDAVPVKSHVPIYKDQRPLYILEPIGNLDNNRPKQVVREPEIQEYQGQRPVNFDVNFTSGHSKLFGISIEDAGKMRSTTQSSVYNTRVSPTLPTWRNRDDTTTKKYPVNINPDVPQCRSTRLAMCRGVLPYDLAGASISINGVEVIALMPQIEYLVATNCSERVADFACAMLEPECSPAPFPGQLPCYSLCKAIIDNCEDLIPRELRAIFNCDNYSRSECIPARGPCLQREFSCADGSCMPRDWICDGNRDCPGGEDEGQCTLCELAEFRCPSGGCILNRWLCDGYTDCPGGEDETEEACESRGRTRAPEPGGEPGEQGAGSAPAPAVRRPSRMPEDVHKTGENDSSKELLITSDSSNALKRNFTRRPSPSRLTPYSRPMLKAKTQEKPVEPPTDEITTEKTSKKFKLIKTDPKKPKEKSDDSDEDVNIRDLFEEFSADKEDKILQNEEKPTLFPLKKMGRAPVPQKEPDSVGTQKPVDRSINTLNRVVDGAAMMAKMAKAAEDEEKPDSLEMNEQNSTITVMDKEDELSESPGISAHASPCPSGELRCVDGRCITLAQLCDGNIDCSDHADEDNCFT